LQENLEAQKKSLIDLETCVQQPCSNASAIELASLMYHLDSL